MHSIFFNLFNSFRKRLSDNCSINMIVSKIEAKKMTIISLLLHVKLIITIYHR
jgi:hypothetical protein